VQLAAEVFITHLLDQQETNNSNNTTSSQPSTTESGGVEVPSERALLVELLSTAYQRLRKGTQSGFLLSLSVSSSLSFFCSVFFFFLLNFLSPL
jgi:hypothetical protein